MVVAETDADVGVIDVSVGYGIHDVPHGGSVVFLPMGYRYRKRPAVCGTSQAPYPTEGEMCFAFEWDVEEFRVVEAPTPTGAICFAGGGMWWKGSGRLSRCNVR